MAKQKKKPRQKSPASGASKPMSWGGKPTQSRGAKTFNILLGFAAVAAVAAGLGYWLLDREAETDFLALAEQGRDRLAGVVTHPNLGRSHLEPGQTHHYAAEFPTSGPHDRVWAEPGFYDAPPPRTRVVHALEHGNIVIYYDRPGSDVLDTLKAWTSLYGGQWDGLLAVPKTGLGESIVLTAWVKELRQERFDPAIAAAFVDEYRGRGPEHPVR